ncbi:MAG: DUF3298 and DUF4163 domain-containing protein [Clostridiaceae bacterium]|nr:DUF3298 and DUF4163 domain-containing protein [Clostridiaceae bacterium]
MLLIKRPADIIIRVYRRPNITMLYPQVAGHENVNAIILMNMKIRNAVMELVKSLDRPDLKTIIEGSFEIKNNQRGILSILLVGLADFGGAHPMTVTKSLTMDTGTGESFSLHQLFKPGYMEIINAEISRQIRERDIPVLDSFKGISPDQDYYVSDHTLVIYYQLYELSPYAAGFPYFPIPLYMLSSVIPGNGLLDRLNYFI